MPPVLSCIVPTLDEAVSLPATLDALQDQNIDTEIVIADGGSRDATLDIAQRYGCRIVSSPPGRGTQMNAGAKAATGTHLLFLHADTIVAKNAGLEIRDALSRPGVIAGSFRLGFDRSSLLLDFFALCSKLNLASFTYGDQGLYLRKETFERLNGFKSYPFLEDVEMQARLRAHGRFVKSPLPVITSSRRFDRTGVLAQQIRNLAIVCAYQAGISPFQLHRFYAKIR